MKVAFFSCSDFVEGNAATARLRAYAKGLTELGVHAAFFTLAPTKFNNSGMNTKMKGVKDGTFFKYICSSNIRSENFLIRNFNKLANMFRCFCFLILEGKRFEVLYLYQPGLPEFLPVYLYKVFSRKPLIAEKTEYEPAYVSITLKEQFSKLLHRINLWLLPFFCKHLVVISERLKAVFVSRFGEDRITIIPAIVDFSRFKENPDIRTNRIGYVGSFAPKDNVEGIIEAFAKAFKINTNLKLRLIGFDPHKKKHDLLIDKAGLNVVVERTGAVTYADVPGLLADCDLLITNKTANAFSEYGFPTKLAEYMATGKPTISSIVGDIPYYIKDGENGFLVEAGNNDALGTKILDRYNNYQKYNLAGKKGKQDCEQLFNNKTQALVFKNLLEGIR